MPNTVTIQFIPCEPAPAQGYKLTWRVLGSADPYTDEGYFTTSPIQFTDDDNPEGTCYEGFLQSDCSESGESGTVLGQAIPWSTPCEESGTTYTISLTNPCNGIYSTYLIEGGTPADVLVVRASFLGSIAKISGTFVRADLTISSPDGTSDAQQSGCFTDVIPHFFAITADTTITMVGTTAVVNLTAVAKNSSESSTSVTLTIISVNGDANGAFVSGCRGNDSDGGTC